MPVIKELEPIFQEFFEDDNISLSAATTSNDIDGWDSMSHVLLMATIENRLKIHFSDREILLFKNVGELCRSIEAKMKSR